MTPAADAFFCSVSRKNASQADLPEYCFAKATLKGETLKKLNLRVSEQWFGDRIAEIQGGLIS